MMDWEFPQDKQKAEAMLAKGYSIGAVAMQFGATGSEEYYRAYEELGFKLRTTCPYCGEVCMGTGDCNCHEE